eukprot:330909-Prorocentrum_minimum.AAC.1
MVRLPSVLYRRCCDFIDGAFTECTLSTVRRFHRWCAHFIDGALISSTVRFFRKWCAYFVDGALILSMMRLLRRWCGTIIQEAINNMGDFKLKTDENYIVPEEQRQNAVKKRRQ